MRTNINARDRNIVAIKISDFMIEKRCIIYGGALRRAHTGHPATQRFHGRVSGVASRTGLPGKIRYRNSECACSGNSETETNFIHTTLPCSRSTASHKTTNTPARYNPRNPHNKTSTMYYGILLKA